LGARDRIKKVVLVLEEKAEDDEDEESFS